MDASTYVLIFISPINVALNVYFVHYTDFGIYGSPIALSFTFSFAFFFLVIYTAYSPTHAQNGTWGGFQLRAVLDARSCITFLKLAIPGILMVGTEWCVTPCLPFFIYSGNVGKSMVRIRILSPYFQGRIRNCSAGCCSSGQYPARRTISHHDHRPKYVPSTPISSADHLNRISLLFKVLNSIPFGIGMALTSTGCCVHISIGAHLLTTQVSPRPHEWEMLSAGATQPGPSSLDTSRRC
jgi:hypothetical protein